jgi:ElaB/YqjD/DUF883 family membrane-anchored ribosome-binding protein
MITENQIKDILDKILLEETSKVRRDDYNRVQYRIEELQNSLNETMKEFRKLNDTLPNGLKTVSNGRVSSISSSLANAQKLISQLKDKIKQHKRSSFSQHTEEKKK